MNLDGVFIPPTGAMQFEVTDKVNGFDGSVLWVIADSHLPPGRMPRCTHRRGDFMLVIAIMHLTKPFALGQGAGMNLVCGCMGRIVE